MTYPVTRKLVGWVDELDDSTVWARVSLDSWKGTELYATLHRAAFGDDASKLQLGSYITLPKRRDRRWRLMPVRPWTEQRARRVTFRAYREARKFKDLFQSADPYNTDHRGAT